jgi:hypothetical protein
MNFSWQHAALLAAIALASCAQSELATDATPLPPTSPAIPPATLTFQGDGTLQLVPGELRTVFVVGRPPAPYEVNFSVLGEAAGAWLDRMTVTADGDGRASVKLHAPNLSALFRLRAATKEGLAAEIGVSVSDKGFGILRVIPTYDGAREATGWTASVVVGATCAELSTVLPSDPAGTLVAQAAPDAPLLVESVPVGPNLAVALRNGQAMWGCTDEPDLQAGSTRDVRVTVKDTPMNLAATSLHLTLALTEAEGMGALFESAIARLMDEFLPEGAEAPALLDAMERAVPAEQQADFIAQRLVLGWDAAVQAHLQALTPPLRDRCRRWTDDGLAQIPFSITGHLRAVGDTAGHALLQVIGLGSLTAQEAGVPPAHQMSWVADPGDVLRLDGTLFWMPSRYVGGVTWFGAAAELQDASTMTAALARAAACPGLATQLTGYPGCDEGCLAEVCAAGLERRWLASLDASAAAGLAGEIAVTASGPARVNDAAAPVFWGADWLGRITDGEGPAVSVHGRANAESPDGDDPR